MTAPAALRPARVQAAAQTIVFDPAALRRARKAARLSLEAAAAHVGRHYSQVARYERGETPPAVDVLCQLAAVYRADPADWFRPQT